MSRIVYAGALLAALGSAWAVPAEGQGGPASAVQPAAVQPAGLKPLYVRPLFAGSGGGHNDSSPTWDGGVLAIERAEESKREILIARPDGSIVKNVYYQTDADDLGLGDLLAGIAKAASYNSGITWAKSGDQFVFMSNAGEGNYDLYLGSVTGKDVQRLTKDPSKDGQPNWSPAGKLVVFVSGRSGGAQLFLLDVATGQAERISHKAESYFYPRWSPDGKRVAAMCGANENHDIVVIDGLQAAPGGAAANLSALAKQAKEHLLTTWSHDDLSPSWSPDGKRIAFFSNYNPEGDPKIWSLLVIDTDGSSPTEGEGLQARVVASNVIPDLASGPAWLPDSKHLAYVRNDKQDYSPIYVVDVTTHKETRVETGTSINHDLAVSSDGIIAFRAQVDQWDQIFLMKLPEGIQ